MKRAALFFVTLFLLAFQNKSFSQTPNSDVLFNIGNESVTRDEFVKVYQKTSVNGDADFSEKSLRDYLDLYINFRLKVKEAREMKLDTTSAVLNEFKTYRSKLTPTYMYDEDVVKEAYDKMQKEIHVEHVLVKLDQSASPADTMKAFKRINNWRNLLLKGKIDFETLATDSSGDASAKQNHGDLGYITAMQLIYPFEAAAYNTPVGKISMPVRTRFGYHLIKVVDVRPSRGTVDVDHLFLKVAANATDEDQQKAKNRIDSLYQVLKSGGNWDDLVKKFSDDKTSSANSGKLPSFGTGMMVSSFEDAAFALQNPGDISQPVHSPYGWHIIKLVDKKPLAPYDSVKDQLHRRIEAGPWADHAHDAYVQMIKTEYAFKEYPAAKKEMTAKMDSSLLKGTWNDSVASKMNGILFSLTDSKYVPETKQFLQKDFADFIAKNQRRYLLLGNVDRMYNKMYDQYVMQSCNNFEDARLEAKYPAFKDLMNEYMNGILLFDLASDSVWNKAVDDSTGLKAFYDAHKNNYMGQERAKVTTYLCKNASVANDVNSYLKQGMNDQQILAKANKKVKDNVQLDTEEFEKGKDSEIEKLGWGTAGTTYTQNGDSGQVRILKIVEIMQPEPKPLSEVKGYVVADYQDYLEKEWVSNLRKKYPVTVNEQVFESLVKK